MICKKCLIFFGGGVYYAVVVVVERLQEKNVYWLAEKSFFGKSVFSS
jgi:hypothetical protein